MQLNIDSTKSWFLLSCVFKHKVKNQMSFDKCPFAPEKHRLMIVFFFNLGAFAESFKVTLRSRRIQTEVGEGKLANTNGV